MYRSESYDKNQEEKQWENMLEKHQLRIVRIKSFRIAPKRKTRKILHDTASNSFHFHQHAAPLFSSSEALLLTVKCNDSDECLTITHGLSIDKCRWMLWNTQVLFCYMSLLELVPEGNRKRKKENSGKLFPSSSSHLFHMLCHAISHDEMLSEAERKDSEERKRNRKKNHRSRRHLFNYSNMVARYTHTKRYD